MFFSSDDVISISHDSNATVPNSSAISFIVSSCAFTIRTIVIFSSFSFSGVFHVNNNLITFFIHPNIIAKNHVGFNSKFLYSLSTCFFAFSFHLSDKGLIVIRTVAVSYLDILFIESIILFIGSSFIFLYNFRVYTESFCDCSGITLLYFLLNILGFFITSMELSEYCAPIDHSTIF